MGLVRQAPCGKERTSRRAISVSSTYRCYRISGETLLDLYAAMGTGARNVDAYTRWDVSWRYSFSGSGLCRIDSLDVTVEVYFMFPRWSNPVGAPVDVVHDWNRFMRALIRHEDGHARLAERIEQPQSCESLG